MTQRFPPALGGVERHVYEISRRLARDHEVDVFTSDLSKDRPFTKLPRSVPERKVERFRLRRFWSVKILPSSHAISVVMPNMIPNLAGGTWDVIHSHALFHFVTYASLLSGVHRSAIVVTPHSDPATRIARTNPALLPLKRANAVIALTTPEKKKFVECGIEARKIFVVPNAIDLSLYRHLPGSNEFRAKFNLEGPIVLYVGRIEIPQKGLDVLIQAMPDVLSDFPRAKFVLAGPDWGGQHVLKKLAQSLHVNPIFTVQLDEVTLIQAYSAADVVVVPSRTEAFAIVLLEAMACGKPIVAARVGAIPEIVDDSNSILTGPEDPHELASAVKKLLLDETLRARLGEAGKRMVYKYSWDTVVRKIEQVYRSAIQRSRESS